MLTITPDPGLGSSRPADAMRGKKPRISKSVQHNTKIAAFGGQPTKKSLEGSSLNGEIQNPWTCCRVWGGRCSSVGHQRVVYMLGSPRKPSGRHRRSVFHAHADHDENRIVLLRAALDRRHRSPWRNWKRSLLRICR